MKKKGIKDMRIQGIEGIEGSEVTSSNRRGRLLRFLFKAPRLGPKPPDWVAYELAGVQVFNRFATRLATQPPDLVTHLGMVRSAAYFSAGCPLELCDHAAARDLWQLIYAEAIASGDVVAMSTGRLAFWDAGRGDGVNAGSR